MILRAGLERRVARALARSPVVTLLGPRQSGKTTLARSIARRRPSTLFDLEDPADAAALAAPDSALRNLKGLVVLDEIQRAPHILPVLRVLADRPERRSRFLLLGSASPDLARGVSESLAGRVRLIDVAGFTLEEAGAANSGRLWLRGGLPRSYLAPSDRESLAWRNDFVRTFLERDVPQLGIRIPAAALRRFWSMVAHFHGQIWNAAEFARSLGSSEPTARAYLDILCGAYVVRALPPWHENLSKRQVKAPKVYVRDTGVLHALLGLCTPRDLQRHPKYGGSWEGFGVEQVLALLRPEEAYFWATHSGAELDLLVPHRSRRLGFEFKCSDAPSATKSMRVALSDLRLDSLRVVYPGLKSYRIDKKIEAVAIRHLPDALR